MFSSARRCRVFSPIPHKSFTATPSRNASSSSARTSTRPSGLPAFVAILARYLFGAIPTVIASPVRARTSVFSLAPVSRAGPSSRSVPVMSRNASSTEICCMCGVYEERMSMTARETSR